MKHRSCDIRLPYFDVMLQVKWHLEQEFLFLFNFVYRELIGCGLLLL